MHRVPRPALLRHSECVSIYTGARHDRAVHALGRVTEAPHGGRAGDDRALAEDGIRVARAIPAGWNQFRDEYRKGGRSGDCRTHSHACAAAVGRRREFSVGGGRDTDSSGDAGSNVEADRELHAEVIGASCGYRILPTQAVLLSGRMAGWGESPAFVM